MESMTGYGMAKMEVENFDLMVEVRSVNHRYSEINLHMPDYLLHLDADLRKKVKNSLARGKVDLYIRLESKGREAGQARLNEEAFLHYLDLVDRAGALGGNFKEASVLDFFSLEGVLENTKQAYEENLDEPILAVVEEALTRAKRMRQNEGKNLEEDILGKLDALDGEIQILMEKKEEILEEQKKDFLQRLQSFMEETPLKGELDEGRIYTELAILADKWTVDEEIVRLNSHLDQFRGIMMDKHPVGRKLDFLLQEFNREANTIASKTKSIPMLNHVVQIKAIIEQLREQVQNIE